MGQKQFVSFLQGESYYRITESCIELELHFETDSGYHIQANQVPDYLIPSEIVLEDTNRSIRHIAYPNPKRMILGGQAEILVFDGHFAIWMELERTPEDLSPSPIKGKLAYQPCDDRKCFFPRELSFELQEKLR